VGTLLAIAAVTGLSFILVLGLLSVMHDLYIRIHDPQMIPPDHPEPPADKVSLSEESQSLTEAVFAKAVGSSSPTGLRCGSLVRAHGSPAGRVGGRS
jgi:hypothetical protein